MWPDFFGTPTYIWIYTLGPVMHGLLAIVLARRMKISAWIGVHFGLLNFFSMFVGARLLSEILHGEFAPLEMLTADYWTNEERWRLWGGPLVYLGLATVGIVAFARRRGVLLDLMVLPLPVSMIIAKIACFANGCCYGEQCALPWAVTFPEGADAPAGIARHPTQLYEIVVLACILVVFVMQRRGRAGNLLPWFVAIYGPGRAAMEFFRPAEELRSPWGPMSASQWVCFAAGLIAVVWLIAQRRPNTREGEAPAEPAP